MPAMVMRYIVDEKEIDNLARLLLGVGGRGGMSRAAQMFGCHRDTLTRGLKRKNFGPKVGQRIIDGLKGKHPEIERMIAFKCG